MSQTDEIIERGKKVLIGNYARLPVVMARGEGAWVWDFRVGEVTLNP